MTKVNIQNIKVDLARTSNGRYESMASRDDRTSDCPIFGLDIILMYLLNVVHSLFVGYINTDRSTDILCIRDMIYDEHQRGKGKGDQKNRSRFRIHGRSFSGSEIRIQNPNDNHKIEKVLFHIYTLKPIHKTITKQKFQ